MKKTTVIFDMDGTLLDTIEDLYQSVIYAQRRMNLPVHTRQQVMDHVGNGIRVLIEQSVPEGTEEEVIAETMAVMKEHYNIHSNDHTRPYEGIMELLAVLKERGYKMAIVSNKPDNKVKDLNHIHFKDYIDVAIGENESGGIRKKPAPDTVMESLRILGSTAEESVYIGDSEVDIATARNSGMDAILCEWGFRSRETLYEAGAKILVPTPDQILNYI